MESEFGAAEGTQLAPGSLGGTTRGAANHRRVRTDRDLGNGDQGPTTTMEIASRLTRSCVKLQFAGGTGQKQTQLLVGTG